MPNSTDPDPAEIASGEDILTAVGATRATIDWRRSTPWWFFLSGFVRLGWRTSHVLFAMIGLWCSKLGFMLADWMFHVRTPANMASFNGVLIDEGSRGFYFLSLPRFFDARMLEPFDDFEVGTSGLALRHIAYLIFLLVWLGIVWGFFGGVIVRRSVVELGVRTTIGWIGSIKLVAKRLRYIVEASGMPALAVLGFCLMPLLLGLIGRLGAAGEVTSAFLSMLGFLIIIPIGWLAMLAFVGFPLITAAIVTEKDSDAFDGLSRAAAYLFQRPVTIILAIGIYTIVASIIYWLVGITYQFSFNLYSQVYLVTAGGLDSSTARSFYKTFAVMIQTLIQAVPISLFCSATAATYLLVRREVDQTQYDELDLNEVGSPLALPPTNYGEAGVLEIGKQEELPLDQSARKAEAESKADSDTEAESKSPADSELNGKIVDVAALPEDNSAAKSSE